MNEKTPEQLAAELVLLRTYDHRRRTFGHDFGCGQRAKELIERQRELELQAGGRLAAARLQRDVRLNDLLAAYARIGRPRLYRAEANSEQYGTKAAHRTRRCWLAIAQYVGATTPS